MNRTDTVKLYALLSLCLLLSGCNRYAFTLNDQPIFQPSSLFNDYVISDTSLSLCIKQAIIDQQVTQADELTYLICTHAGVSSLEGISIFNRLNRLDLSANNLGEIKPLLFLPNMDTVNLKENPSLSCNDAHLLAKQITGGLTLPAHCI